MKLYHGPNTVCEPQTRRGGTSGVAAATAADKRCAQAKRDRSNSSPPPPSQWSPWSRVLQRTPFTVPRRRRNGSSHATLRRSSTVGSLRLHFPEKFSARQEGRIRVCPPTQQRTQKVTRSRRLVIIYFSSHFNKV